VPKCGALRIGVVLLDPASHGLGAVEGEDCPRSRIRVEAVREARLDAGRLIRERQPVEPALHLSRDAGGVLARLDLDLGEGHALRLRLDRPDSLPVHEHEVVGSAVALRHRELSD
jgi:hypothetical protein